MFFLNPLALIGLAAATIPILIHLFNFRKPRRVDFSSLQFLKELERRAMRRMKLKQWLLLALRTLAIAFLVLTFARPTVESAWASVFGARVEMATAVIIDNSQSMTVRDSQGELFDQAKELAASLVADGRPGDELFLISAADGPLRPTAFGQPGSAQDALETLTIGPSSMSIGSSLQAAFGLFDQASLPDRRVLVISDFQQTFLRDSSFIPAPAGTKITLMPLGERVHPNTAVREVTISGRIPEVGQPLIVAATLEHFGPSSEEEIQVSLYVEGERVAQSAARITSDVPATVELTVTPRRSGRLAAYVQIESDAFPFDDVRHLVLNIPESRRVLLVQGEGQAADFLSLALQLGDEDERFIVTTVPESRLPEQQLELFDVVALVGPASLADGTRATIERYVASGGGVLVFPSTTSNESLSALLQNLGAGSFGPLRRSATASTSLAGVAGAAYDHPLFEGVLDFQGDTPRLESPEIRQFVPFNPMAGQSLISFSGGTPFLHEVRYEQGTILIYAVAPDLSWSDFPTRGLFVPLMHRSIQLLAAEVESEAAIELGNTTSVRIPGVGPGLMLVDPQGEESIPEQRAVPGGVLLDLDELAFPGVYDVMDGSRVVYRFAANGGIEESDLTLVSAADAVRFVENMTGAEVSVLDAAGGRGTAAASLAADGSIHTELWQLFLTLALVCLLIEMAVTVRWKK